MPNKLQIEQPKDEIAHDKREALNNLIQEQVISALGEPIDLRDVQVKKLWDNRFRVNILVGVNAAAVSIAHSYFLVIDSDGMLLTSTPTITKQY